MIRFERFFIVIFVCVATLCSSPVMADARVGAYGFAPAMPEQQVPDIRVSRMPRISVARDVEFRLLISADGALDSITCDSLGQRWMEVARPFITALTFVPAELDDQVRASQLPVSMQIEPRMRAPQFRFPVSSDGEIDHELLMRSLSLNSVQPPSIDYFPSYYYTTEDDSDSAVPSSLLLRLDLDQSGEVVQITTTWPSGSGRDSQLRSAVRWARFSPLRIDNQPRSTSTWLAVTFYPHATYPSFAFPSESDVPWERFRLQLLPDTVGLMQRPIPKRSGYDHFSFQGDHIYYRDTVSVIIHVDTLGQVRLRHLSRTEPEVLSAISQATAKTLFYPALGFDGYGRSFTGRALFILEGSTTIRIDYFWLR